MSTSFHPAVALVLTTAAQWAFAHPGHGVAGPLQHDAEHGLWLATALGVVLWAAVAVRRLAARRRDG